MLRTLDDGLQIPGRSSVVAVNELDCMRQLGLAAGLPHSSKSDLHRVAAMQMQLSLRYIDGSLHDRGGGNVARMRLLNLSICVGV